MEEPDNHPAREKPVMGNERIEAYLKETAEWGKLLAVVGYVIIGLLVLVALVMMFGLSHFMKGAGSKFPMFWIGLGYIILASVYYIPITYLYRFSVQVKQAVPDNNEEAYTTAFQNLKSLFKFLGIFAIVILAIYALILLVALPLATMLK